MRFFTPAYAQEGLKQNWHVDKRVFEHVRSPHRLFQAALGASLTGTSYSATFLCARVFIWVGRV